MRTTKPSRPREVAEGGREGYRSARCETEGTVPHFRDIVHKCTSTSSLTAPKWHGRSLRRLSAGSPVPSTTFPHFPLTLGIGERVYDREDALRLAQAAYRKAGYEKEQETKEQGEGQTLGEMFEGMGLPRRPRIRFSNPDIAYLTSRLELNPRFIGRMIRTFGEAVVLESLRRFRAGMSEGVFFGICRNVERDAGGFPHSSL